MKLSDNVYRLESAFESAVYLIKYNGAYTLIDTGYAPCGRGILRELDSLGVSALDKILITHHDIDHIGNMSLLQRHYKCKVFINSLDMPYVRGEKRRAGKKCLVDMVIKTDISAELTPLESATLEGFSFLHTPGHTPGHTCFIFEGFLFSGDVFRLPVKRLLPPMSRANWNTFKLSESLRNIITLDYEWICPAHFLPARKNDIVKRRQLFLRRKK